MSLTPRKTLNADFIDGMTCAICGSSDLSIVHIEVYPDFVTCQACGSAFVVEDEGQWIMYGKISPNFPQTSEFALRQWTWPDAVAEQATRERLELETSSGDEIRAAPPAQEARPKIEEAPAAPPAQEAPPKIEEAPAESVAGVDKAESSAAMGAQAAPSLGALLRKVEQAEKEAETGQAELPSWEMELAREEQGLSEDVAQSTEAFPPKDEQTQAEIAAWEWLPDEVPEEAIEMEVEEEPFFEAPFISEEAAQAPAETSQKQSAKEPSIAMPMAEPEPSEWPPSEPEPGKRYQVIVSGDQLKHPKNVCAHCLRPPHKEFTVPGSLPDMPHPGNRKSFIFELPLCRDCMKRSRAASPEEANAKLLAKLLSGLIAMFSIIALLAFGIVKLDQQPLVGIFALLIFAALTYTLASLLLHRRAERHPPPEDAAYVLSTLLIEPGEEGTTKFEWRNPKYAELFRQVNHGNVVEEMALIEDRFALIRPKSDEQAETAERVALQDVEEENESAEPPEVKPLAE